ncbi:sensor histidine kinase [Arthrobacter castelli]|uniref:sensor histidine kinase n=1 Tax=Arthrobacter castelli TaxID=271431 RepID=UPI0012DE7453|nr:histidine kinase [Arthrobacter castelli]
MNIEAPHGRFHPADVLLAATLTFIGMVGTAPAGAEQPSALEPDLTAYILVAAATGSIAAWRRFPLTVFVITGTATACYLLIGYPFGPILFPAALAVGGLAASWPLRRTAIAVGVDAAVLALALTFRFIREPHGPFDILVGIVFALALWFAAPMAVGTAWRIRSDSRARVREEQAKRVVSEERLRMAQEVHDGVGHGLSVIAMQAGVGLHVADRNPAKAKEILETIRQTSRDSLDGLRRELAMLRGEPSPRQPGLGLADVATLVDRVRAGGLEVALDNTGTDSAGGATGTDNIDGTAIPDEIGFASYRIVQEALTNVLRHAGSGSTAAVKINRTRSAVLIEVSDTGSGPPGGGPVEGSGIAGMRQRALQAGGSLEVAGTAGAGFRVRARLPLAAGTQGGTV